MSKKALEKSIEKWEKIVRSRNALDRGSNNCALCREYMWFGNCSGCPVRLEVDAKYCVGTPHEKWCDHHEKDHKKPTGPAKRQKDCPECLRLANEELEFLKSLRKYYD